MVGNELCLRNGGIALRIRTLDNHTWLSFDEDIIGPWVCERAGGQYQPGRFKAIGRVTEEGQIMAGVLYEETNGVSVVCHIAGEGRWANRHFLWVIFHYPFVQLGLNRITTIIEPQNVKSQEFVKKLGFELETALEGSHPLGDLQIYRIFKRDCRWLEEKK